VSLTAAHPLLRPSDRQQSDCDVRSVLHPVLLSDPGQGVLQPGRPSPGMGMEESAAATVALREDFETWRESTPQGHKAGPRPCGRHPFPRHPAESSPFTGWGRKPLTQPPRPLPPPDCACFVRVHESTGGTQGTVPGAHFCLFCRVYPGLVGERMVRFPPASANLLSQVVEALSTPRPHFPLGSLWSAFGPPSPPMAATFRTVGNVST
jgi:hypothetical protein